MGPAFPLSVPAHRNLPRKIVFISVPTCSLLFGGDTSHETHEGLARFLVEVSERWQAAGGAENCSYDNKDFKFEFMFITGVGYPQRKAPASIFAPLPDVTIVPFLDSLVWGPRPNLIPTLSLSR